MKKVIALVIDDDPSKRTKLVSCIKDILNGSVVIHEAASVRSGRKMVRQLSPDLVVLDMSLPTFDIAYSASGGRPQGCGGEELLRYMQRDGASGRAVIVSAYEDFSHAGREATLEDLALEWRQEFPELLTDVIFFSSILGGWEDKLAESVNRLKEFF